MPYRSKHKHDRPSATLLAEDKHFPGSEGQHETAKGGTSSADPQGAKLTFAPQAGLKGVHQTDTPSKDVDFVDTPTSSTCTPISTTNLSNTLRLLGDMREKLAELDTQIELYLASREMNATPINTENAFSQSSLARVAESLLNGDEPSGEDAETFRDWLESEDSAVLPAIGHGNLHDAIRATVEAIRSATTSEVLRGYRRELVGLLTVWKFSTMGGTA